MVRKARVKVEEHLRDGDGTCIMYHGLEKEEFHGHGRVFAKIVIKPHSSIGWHQHVGETEPYYILSGHGIFVDNDKSETLVGPDDVCLIEVGQSHAFINNTDEDVVMMALVYNE